MELNARDLVGAAPVPWCLVDGEGRVVRVNDRMAELCESSPAKLEGREFLDLVDPTDRARILGPTCTSPSPVRRSPPRTAAGCPSSS